MLHLPPGSYEIELIFGELAGAAHCEVFAARGAKTAVDPDFRLLTTSMFLPAAELNIVPVAPEEVQISWADGNDCRQLQSAPTVTGPWTNVPGFVNGGTVSTTPDTRYFRAVQ